MSFLSNVLQTDFFNNRPDVKAYCSRICAHKKQFSGLCPAVRMGTYAVSGRYLVDKLLEKAKGEEFLFHIQDEMFSNIASIAGERLASIIDRGAQEYLARARLSG